MFIEQMSSFELFVLMVFAGFVNILIGKLFWWASTKEMLEEIKKIVNGEENEEKDDFERIRTDLEYLHNNYDYLENEIGRVLKQMDRLKGFRETIEDLEDTNFDEEILRDLKTEYQAAELYVYQKAEKISFITLAGQIDNGRRLSDGEIYDIEGLSEEIQWEVSRYEAYFREQTYNVVHDIPRPKPQPDIRGEVKMITDNFDSNR